MWFSHGLPVSLILFLIVGLSIFLSVSFFVYLSAGLNFVCSSVFIWICLCKCLHVGKSVWLLVYISLIYLFAGLSKIFYLLFCLHVCLIVCLFACFHLSYNFCISEHLLNCQTSSMNLRM